MTHRRGVRGAPRDYLAGGAAWPGGNVGPDESMAISRAVAIAAAVSERLGGALEGRPVAAVARDADVSRSTIYDLVNGGTWPDLVTVTKLEEALDTDLWTTVPR
jgi:hypothetical protein